MNCVNRYGIDKSEYLSEKSRYSDFVILTVSKEKGPGLAAGRKEKKMKKFDVT